VDESKIMNRHFLNLLKTRLAEIEAIWGFFGPRAHDCLGASSVIPINFISCCDWGQEHAWIDQSIQIFSIEKEGGVRLNWSNQDLDLNLKNQGSNSVHQFMLQSRHPLYCLCYRSFEHLEDMARRDQNILILSAPVNLKNFFDDKILLRKMLPRLEITPPQGECGALDTLDFGLLQARHGDPFVIQFPFGSSGERVFLISCRSELLRLQNNFRDLAVNVTAFLDGPCLNINACVIEDSDGLDVISSPPSVQIIGAPELSHQPMAFCGNDFTALQKVTKKVQNDIQEYTSRIGQWMGSKGFRGIFGVDFLTDHNAVYPIEINPRFQNSTSLLTHLSLERKDLPLVACHVNEFLRNPIPRPCPADRLEQTQRNFSALMGCQIILHNRLKTHVRVGKELLPGVYEILDGKLHYLRKGLTIESIQRKGEFLITGGVPELNKHLAPGAVILKIQTRHSLLESDLKRLSKWAKECTTYVYQALELKTETAIHYAS
jgi:hypothetical protein